MTREFAYRAYSQDGQFVQGRLDAVDSHDLLEKLNARGLSPFESNEVRPASRRLNIGRRRSLSKAELCQLFRDLATLVEASLTVDHALRLNAAQAGSARRKAVLRDLHEKLIGGRSLADAMAERPDVFSGDKIATVRAGETTGDLATVLRDLCVGMEHELDLRGRVAGAFIYPGVLAGVALFALALVFTVMVPALVPLFENQSKPMPIALTVATSLGDLLGRHGTAFALFGSAAFVGATFASRTERFLQQRDKLLLKAPVIGSIVCMSATARVARMLAILLRSGAPVPKALAVAAEAAPMRIVGAELNRALERLKTGAGLAEVLADLTFVPESSRSLILVGENTNRLAEMLVRAAELNEKDVGRRVERVMTFLTPALTIAIGAIVGGLVVSVMSAILDANDLAF